MGVIDSTLYKLTCSCGNTEFMKILQHGSSYGASWQAGGAMKNFQVSWGPVGLHGPEIVEAICKFCGAKAEVHLS